jgi:hypothetical protein
MDMDLDVILLGCQIGILFIVDSYPGRLVQVDLSRSAYPDRRIQINYRDRIIQDNDSVA